MAATLAADPPLLFGHLALPLMVGTLPGQRVKSGPAEIGYQCLLWVNGRLLEFSDITLVGGGKAEVSIQGPYQRYMLCVDGPPCCQKQTSSPSSFPREFG